MKLLSKADINILDYAYNHVRKETPIAVLPCPIKKGQIYPQTTRLFWKPERIGKFFIQQMTDVVCIKPIYYETLKGAWRPMSEVAYGFGNRWLNLKEDWDTKMHPRYLKWLMGRMEMIGGSVNFPFPKIGMQPIREGREIFFALTEVFPAAGANSPVDGLAGRRSVDETIANIVSGAGTLGGEESEITLRIILSTSTTTDQFNTLDRILTLFDASAIDDGDTKDSAIYSLFVVNRTNDLTGGAEELLPILFLFLWKLRLLRIMLL